MKGARAVEPPKTITAPTTIKIKIAGKSQNFLRARRKPQISFIKSINSILISMVSPDAL